MLYIHSLVPLCTASNLKSGKPYNYHFKWRGLQSVNCYQGCAKMKVKTYWGTRERIVKCRAMELHHEFQRLSHSLMIDPMCFVYCIFSKFVFSPIIVSLSNRYFLPLLCKAITFWDHDLERIRNQNKSLNNTPVRSIKIYGYWNHV